MRKLALSGLAMAVVLLFSAGPAEAANWLGFGWGSSRGCSRSGGCRHAVSYDSSGLSSYNPSQGQASCGRTPSSCGLSAISSQTPCWGSSSCASGQCDTPCGGSSCTSGQCNTPCGGSSVCAQGVPESSREERVTASCGSCKPWWRRTAACYKYCSPSTCQICGGVICSGGVCGDPDLPEPPSGEAPVDRSEPPLPAEDVPPPPQA